MPIAIVILSVISFGLSAYGFVLALLTTLSELFSPFSVTAVVTGFTLSVICCSVGFMLTKSKLCLAGGIISAVSVLLGIASFIILF